MKVRLTFTTPLLGTLSGDKQLATDFILTKHPDGVSKDELDASREISDVQEKKSTIFARTDNRPHLWDYQAIGFFKGSCEAIINSEEFTKKELKDVRLTAYLYKKTLDTLVHVLPRKIFLILPDGADADSLDFLERPLRGQTMKGERISLARSEVAPAGTEIEFEYFCDNPKHEEWIVRFLDKGKWLGFGQWRSGGMGRFDWQELKS